MLFLQIALGLAGTFEIVGDEFQLNGKPFQIISGSFHYFRQHPSAWENTIKKMANGGLNTVQTYVAWNLHEPRKGEYNWEGMADLLHFIDLCQKYNMWVVLRPGPFICAEWDFGGFPYWLMQDLQENEFRRSNQKYQNHIEHWLNVLLPKILPKMIYNGGPILMCQIENEYGLYGACDHAYMEWIAKLNKELLGDKAVLFTTDPAYALGCGAVPKYAHACIDFGTGQNIEALFKQQKDTNGHGPYMNSEFYPGWLDHWQEAHHTVSTDAICKDLDKMLSLGASVNFYMYIGGTNFYWYNGANGDHHSYQADPTSYDYDAPLSEAGDMTYKWSRILDVIKKYRTDIPQFEVSNSTKRAYGEVKFTEGVTLHDAIPNLDTKIQDSDVPLTYEELDLDYGYILYTAEVGKKGTLNMPKVHDRAWVFVNKERQGIVQHAKEKALQIPAGELDILVEHMGRNNFGGEFVETKGITDGATMDGLPLGPWRQIGFNLKDISRIQYKSVLPKAGPAFYRGYFNVDQVADTFLNPKGFTKGVAFINGFHIGRYWTVGPQLTLYVPGALLKQGQNELVIFETESLEVPNTMKFDDTPQISII